MKKCNKTRLVFIRHGQSLRNKLCPWPYLPDDEKIIKILGEISDRDTPLSEIGFEQAQKTGLALRKIFGMPDIIFHSGYLRAEQTAREIFSAYKKNEKKKIKFLVDDSIRERAVGHVYNMPESEARKFFPWIKNYRELFSDFDFCPPGGESLVEVVDRVRDFINFLVSAHSGKTIFIVSHGRAIQCAMYNLLGRDFKAVFEKPEGPIKNCGITIFEKINSDKDFILIEYNRVFCK